MDIDLLKKIDKEEYNKKPYINFKSVLANYYAKLDDWVALQDNLNILPNLSKQFDLSLNAIVYKFNNTEFQLEDGFENKKLRTNNNYNKNNLIIKITVDDIVYNLVLRRDKETNENILIKYNDPDLINVYESHYSEYYKISCICPRIYNLNKYIHLPIKDKILEKLIDHLEIFEQRYNSIKKELEKIILDHTGIKTNCSP